MKKMNNKGFSLVELIVVVLIMAIIAVALAPQVMRWVENSRKSNDIEAYNALLEACNVAATDETVIAECSTTLAEVAVMDKNGTTIQGSGNYKSNWTTAIARTIDISSCKITSGDWSSYKFVISAKKENGGVTVSKAKVSTTLATGQTNCYPEKDFS